MKRPCTIHVDVDQLLNISPSDSWLILSPKRTSETYRSY